MTIGDLLARWPELARAAGPLAINHLWEATLFAGAVLLLAGVPLRRAPAGARYRLYLLASIKFLLPSAALASLASRLGARVDLAPRVPEGALALIRADGWMAALGERLAAWLPGAAPLAGTAAGRAALSWIVAVALALWALGALAVATLHLCCWARIARVVGAARPPVGAGSAPFV